MSSEPSPKYSLLYPSASTSLTDVQTTTPHQQPAYTQSDSNDSPKSRLSCPQPSSDASSICSDVSGIASMVHREPSCNPVFHHDLYEAFYGLPPSSTPDPFSPDAPSPSSKSSTAPLTQRIFTDQLQARLHNLLDQEWNENESHVEKSFSQSPKSDCNSVESSQNSQEDIQQGLAWTKIAHGDDTSSDISTESSWSLSPRKRQILLEGVYPEIPLTHRNKRKHDFSHGMLESLDSDGETTDVNDGEPSPTRKKTKVRTGSTISVSTTFSYQTNETASSRKLRSLRSTTSSFSSADSTVVTSPLTFVHPIIHPPSNPPRAPNSRPEVAEARIKQLLKREKSYRVKDGLPTGSFELSDVSSDESNNLFGIEPEFRRRVVEWILEVIPPRYLNSQDFYRHLKYSEETRFHAIYLFSRFFLRIAECDVHPGMLETKEMKAARLETTWDVAFCCLVISTKFYHDFLYPLNPIYSRQFLAIAPQMLGHDQFERIQRDVLEAFDYEVHGITPHAFFEELWDALPSLRELLRFRRTRVNTCDEMWDILQLAALEYDVMRYPVSLLTVAALIESILITLVYEYEKEEEDRLAEQPSTRLNCYRARDEIRPVAQEMSRLIGTTVADLDACRHWLSAVTSRWTY